jgi:phosphatidylglycerol:prolipoprotein diacylglycerol transferase
LIGGFLACSWLIWRKGVDYLVAADATAPALAIGYAIGRIGCFLVGDDYGRPTNAWFGIAFPKGSPPTTAAELRNFGVSVDPSIPPDTVLRVHPTQLYESAAAFTMFAILMWLNRREHPKGRVWGTFLILLGIERFLVEIVRAKDDRFLGSFTIAQLISVLLVVAGSILISLSRAKTRDLR